MPEGGETYRVADEARRDVPIAIMILAMVVMGAVAVGHLPARVPTHFGLNGQPDG